ncbi:TPA: hypothetical protein TXV00_002282, partial [Streptococcus suis]|nr:hypothetical protein [Streptococcus suis]
AVEQQLEETTDTLIDKDHVVVETASISEGLDYTNLNQALSSPIIDASTTSASTSASTIPGFRSSTSNMFVFKGTRIQREFGKNTLFPVYARASEGFSSIRLYRVGDYRKITEEETDSGFTIDQSTGEFSGTPSAIYNEVGDYPRALIYTDSSGRTSPPQHFRIFVVDTAVDNTSLTNRLYNHTPSEEEVLDAVIVLDAGYLFTSEKRLMSPIPTTDGTVTVRIVIDDWVYKDVQVPITYQGAPTVTVSEQSVDRSGKTVIDVSAGVTVMDAEDDRDPHDSLTTNITYTVKDSNGSTVYQGDQPNVPVEKLVAGSYKVTVTATDAYGAKTEQTYVLNVTDRNPV